MSSINNASLGNLCVSLDHLTALNDSCSRVRYGKHSQESFLQRIGRVISEIFSRAATVNNDQREFAKYSACIKAKITQLQEETRGQPDNYSNDFYMGIKTLLHVKAKIEYTGWAKSLKTTPAYAEFKKDLEQLHKVAIENVGKWETDKGSLPQVSKHQIKRWIEADDKQLQFAGYSNEIVYKADEVPLGAVLVTNPSALNARDRMEGYGVSFARKIEVLKAKICALFIGLPVSHAMASLGGGKFVHVSDSNVASGKPIERSGSIPLEEDLSLEARSKIINPKTGKSQGVKYMFGYEIMLPNYDRIATAMNRPVANVHTALQEWSETILTATKPKEVVEEGGQTKIIQPVSSNKLSIISTIFNTKRPANYAPADDFNSHPDTRGYSCSGLISSSMAKHGIDVGLQFGKKVNKVTPADFVKSDLFDLAYSNDRSASEAVRVKMRVPAGG